MVWPGCHPESLSGALCLPVSHTPQLSTHRTDKIEGFHSTFRQVAERMEKLQLSHRAFILNPAVGVGVGSCCHLLLPAGDGAVDECS